MTRCVVLGFFCGVCLVLLGAWIEGYNFDERSSASLLVYVSALGCGVIGAAVFALIHHLAHLEQ
ncbi:MAG TPA: hypothetical protein ENJ50_04930 [Planctomycetaceae bacterium]|nr:hypothetical protein [Planctomycetaceae bacterium]